jgi:hypothetical protein
MMANRQKERKGKKKEDRWNENEFLEFENLAPFDNCFSVIVNLFEDD